MAGDLDFSVQLRLLNDQFNNGINEARDRFTQYAQSVQRNVTQMNADTERATASLAELGNVRPDRLTAELRATADQLRNMGAGANLSGEQVQNAMRTAATQVTRLGSELDQARLEATRLAQTGASPRDLETAAQNVNRLEAELGQARSASVSLANELSGAMNRAASTTDGARNALYRMTNIRVPETIRGEINQLNRALADFTNNSGRPAAEIERVTRATQEQIRRLEAELRGLDETQDRTTEGARRFTGGINGVRGAMGSLQGMLAAAGLGIGISEIIETSDAFKTLEARIKLATGEGASFVSGFEGVKDIANETFSSVENTGELFARITQASEALGLAQKDVLGITRTINEAIKLSGGSAASADAAITQLIQGLQSGVVRGDEFNSIMEQSPRLAQAMADGLGVTRGELRAMAADGKLTSEVVINSIRSQSDVIAQEFGTLPNTVGNAIQVVKNQLFNFIGEMDKTVNQSSILAEAISAVGDSLEDLDPQTVAAIDETFNQLIETVGIFWRRIVDTYTDLNNLVNSIVGGSKSANEQVGLITASLSGVSIFIGAINDGMKAIEITGRVIESVLATWSAMAARFVSYLTFGETRKALQDIADALDEHAVGAMDRANNKALEFESSFEKAMLNAGKSASTHMSEAAKAATDAYDTMKADGTVAAEAVEGAFAKMAEAQIAAYGESALGALQAEAAERNLTVAIGETGKAIVEKMDNEQIASTSAQNAAKALDSTYRELADSLSIGLSKGYADAKASVLELSGSFDVLTDSGYQTGEVLAAALTNMTSKAKNTTELQDIILMWEDLGTQGQLTGEDLAAGLDLANERLDELTDGVNSVNEAYKVLGLTTRKEAALQAEAYTQAYGIIVKDGEATAGQLAEGFKKYAKAAVAANGDVVTAQLKAEAAQRGLTIAVGETGRVTFKSMGEASGAIRTVRPAADDAATGVRNLGDVADDAGKRMVKSARDATKEFKKLRETVDDQGRALNTEGDVIRAVSYTEENAFDLLLQRLGLSESSLTNSDRNRLRSQASQMGKADGHLRDPYKYGLTNAMQANQMADKFVESWERRMKKEEWHKDIASRRDDTSSGYVPQAQLPQSALDAIANLSKTPSFDTSKGGATKTIDVNFKLGDASALVSMPENQENALMQILQQLQDSKAIAGY